MELIRISDRLRRDVAKLEFAEPVTHVYNPIEYARAPHRVYLERYGKGPKEVLLVGMNPGPFGMAQTGVPFGEVAMVRDWLGIAGAVKRPRAEHPKRPILGFDCPRSEVSGARLWGWARDRFQTPERFFARFFVWNYCPLCFMEASGCNRTPDKLPANERDCLYALCDAALRSIVETLQPRYVIGVGAFAEARARNSLAGCDAIVARIPHPSPANPNANRGWAAMADRELGAIGIRL
jgi:single-strand selective monofunctional uracil DNA glycosylase